MGTKEHNNYQNSLIGRIEDSLRQAAGNLLNVRNSAFIYIRSLTPQLATGNALALHFQKNDFNVIGLAFLVICLNMIRPGPAWSHKVSIFAYLEGDKILTEGYFNDGSPCKESLIQVFDPEGKELVKGKTDKKGFFSFNIPNNMPERTDLRIVLTAGLGHKAEYVLHSSEMPDMTAENRDTLDRTDLNKEIFVKNDDLYKKDAIVQTLTKTDLDRIHELVEESVEQAVENGMRPLMRTLAKAEATRISVTEVIGGVGYIFGIMGIIIYFKKRDN